MNVGLHYEQYKNIAKTISDFICIILCRNYLMTIKQRLLQTVTALGDRNTKKKARYRITR
jgi:valyl-tRNA synthetase